MVFSTEAVGVLQVFDKPFSEIVQISKSKTLSFFCVSLLNECLLHACCANL